MATINDVAARAGVSTATVSRALNGKASVDPALVERVLAAADELGYHPNAVARSLRRQTTSVLALIISDIENPFFTSMARGVEDIAQAAGHSVVLCNSDEDAGKERRYLDVAIQDRVAGVILSPTSASTDITTLVEHRIPLVAIDRPLGRPTTDTVLVGSRRAARDATAHLVEQGFQRIACITGPKGVQTADERLAGYRDALRSAGRRTSVGLIRRTNFKVTGGRSAAEELLAQAEPPDAILAANSLLAVGALEVVRERRLRLGQDIGVVAFDDAPWAGLVDPPLTVVAQPAYEVGAAAAQLLLGRIGDEEREPVTMTLSARLIVRGSSRRQR